MAKRFKFITILTAVLGLAFLFMACGSGGGGGDVTYEGSTDPAVADSTTAPTLAEFAMGITEAGFPLATPFVTPPSGSIPTALSAQPLIAWDFTTTVILPVPDGAIIYGSEYSPMGTGTADINGTLTMLVGNSDSAAADTWYVISAELDGSIEFDAFRTEEGPDLTGTATVPYARFYFEGPAEFSASAGNFTDTPDNPGTIVWQEVEMTFTSITVSDEGDSWTLGEGDWSMEISPGISVDLDINSQTVEYDGSTYKLEDTNLFVEFSESAPTALEAAVPLAGSQTTFYITGIGEDCGIFYHPVLGVIYFSGELTEMEPPGDITEGELNFFDDVTEGLSLFYIYFGYDETYNEGEGATVYELNMDTEEYSEIGYFIDGTFIPDPGAPPLG